VRCLRENPANNGYCPVADSGITVHADNKVVVQIYDLCSQRGIQINTKDGKTIFFVKPVDVKAIMDIMGVPSEDRPEVMGRIMTYEAACNHHRPRIRKAGANIRKRYR